LDDSADMLEAKAGRAGAAGAAAGSCGVSGRLDPETGTRALTMACSMAGRTL
jgi:hypothetical protein